MNNDTTNRTLSILGGVGLGAAIMYFLDPERGRRRRHLVRDRVVHATHVAGGAIGSTARDVQNRARGAAAETRARLRHDEPDDEVLVARVRTALGRACSHPGAIVTTAERGVVTLSGPILADEVQPVLHAVRGVRDVQHVVNRLEAHDAPGHVPGLQGQGGKTTPALERRWSPTMRLTAIATGGALAATGAERRDPFGAALGLVGLALALRGATNAPVRRLVGLGGARGAIDVRKTIEIAAPPAEVFAFFADQERWPEWMSSVREVRAEGDGRTHWVVDGPAGVPVEWDAVTTAMIANELIAWKTLPGAVVHHIGRIEFIPTPTGGTRVDIRMRYEPPAASAGHAVATVFGVDPRSQLDADLERLKTTIETGNPPHDAARPVAGRLGEEAPA